MTRLLSQKYHRHVCIQAHETLFWRYQNYDKFHLATIEAIYWFYREFHAVAIKSEDGAMALYKGEYDDLLWYFYRNYSLIQGVYKENPDRSFCKRKLDAQTYIRYGDAEEPSVVKKDAEQEDDTREKEGTEA
jgi:hypothetical protein